ncbi:hypothetical protein DENIT_160022 [Pseudomonas veronii]|nr:hypothetical protein DENIT_160022 [Pseudomonas veronii]
MWVGLDCLFIPKKKVSFSTGMQYPCQIRERPIEVPVKALLCCIYGKIVFSVGIRAWARPPSAAACTFLVRN